MLLCLLGPSGSGKTTVEKELAASGLATPLVSHTTRPMRDGEINGREYIFVDDATFNKIDFIEKVTYGSCNHVYRYGLSTQEVRKTDDLDKDFTAVVDVNGVIQLAKHCTCPVHVVYLVAIKDELINRLKGRNTNDVDSRIALIESELRMARFADDIIINRDGMLDNTIRKLKVYLLEQGVCTKEYWAKTTLKEAGYK